MNYIDCLRCGNLNYFLHWFGYIHCWGCNNYIDLTEQSKLYHVERKETLMYNITNWEIKCLRNLIIPLKYLGEREIDRFIYEGEDAILFYGSELDYSMTGVIKDDEIIVSDIDLWGESSGSIFHSTLIPALRKSTGELEAVIVWEGGDEITRLTVKDGKVNEETIEL